MAVLAGKLEARREDCAPVAGKSTLNRLELSRPAPTRYQKIAMSRRRSRLVRRPFPRGARGRPGRSRSTSTPPTTRYTVIRRAGSSTAITIATAICRSMCSAAAICWRPSSGPPTSTEAPDRSRKSRASSPRSGRDGRRFAFSCAPIRLLPRGADGLVRSNRVDFVFGLARNPRLVAEIAVELLQAEAEAAATGNRPPLQGLPLCDARQLVAPAPGDRQGGMDRGRG